MGIVAKQSALNSLALATGLLLGAVNTMYVLPKAFEGVEEEWGLIRVLTAWGTILAQVVALGSPSAILRFLPTVEQGSQKEASMLTTLFVLPAIALSVLGLTAMIVGGEALKALDADGGTLLQDRMGAFLFMAAAYLAMLLLKAALIYKMRTVVVTVIQEVWLKGSYLVLALLYLGNQLNFPEFFMWFLCSYAAAVFLMVIEAYRAGVQFQKPQINQDAAQFLGYGMYAVWNEGARIVSKHLDFVMVGALLGLAAVPRYTFAFFIATVVSMPLRAMTPILRSLTAKSVANDGPEKSGEQLQQAARVQLIVTSSLLVAILSGMPVLDLVLSDNYQGLLGVVLAVGLAFVLEASAGTAGPILQFSSRYKMALPINLGLVIMTIISNYVFIEVLDMGILGAAWATALTGLWNMAWRTSLMWRLFNIHPFSRGWLLALLFALSVAIVIFFVPLPEWIFHQSPLVQLTLAVLRGAFAGGAVLSLSWATGCLPELTAEWNKRYSR